MDALASWLKGRAFEPSKKTLARNKELPSMNPAKGWLPGPPIMCVLGPSFKVLAAPAAPDFDALGSARLGP